MYFWKSSLAVLGAILFSTAIFCANAKPVQASALLRSSSSAIASTSTMGTIRQVRVDPIDGTAYILGSATGALGVMSADGTSFSVANYSTALPAVSGADLAVSNGRIFIVVNGATNALYRYDISGPTAMFVASSTLIAGTSAITLGDSSLYVSKGTSVYSFGTDLSSLASTATASSSITRLAYGGGQLFYLSGTGRFVRAVLGVSDTTVGTGGPSSVTVKGLVASNDGSALYYASNSALSKLSVAGGATLWTTSISNLAGIDVNTSTGRITVINTSGTVTTYNPINPVSSVSTSASGTSALLNWTTGVSDSDFGGVMIRRSTSDYPANVTDGDVVTSSAMGTSLVDTGLDAGTYYYSFFNQTSDGYYSAAVTSTVTIDLPPEAPSLLTTSIGSSIGLLWTVPADTDTFVLRRDTVEFPATHTDGTAVTTTASSVTGYMEMGIPDGTYYYSIFAVDAGGNYSPAGTASITIDTTAPLAPTLDATVSSSSVSLSWDTPAGGVFFVLRRSTSGFPATISSDTGVTSTGITSFVDVGLDDGTYYYSIFTRDDFNNFSSAGTASVHIDTTAPGAPTSFSAVASGDAIHLSWVNPIDSDFVSSTIRRSMVDFPVLITDDTFVSSTIATSYADQSLADGTYYYSIFAEDSTGHVSVQATSTAIVNTYVPPLVSVASGGGGGGVGAGASFFVAPTPMNTVLPIFSVPAKTASMTDAALSASLPVAKTAPLFTRVLRQGDQGNDVKALQVFLNTHGFVVTKNGLGSPNHESTFFGAATAKAVKKFQEVNKETILKPYHLEKGTGVFGVKMRELIKSMN